MASCNGTGFCFQQCYCGCYEADDTLSKECSCGHRNHIHIIGGNEETDIYCQIECIYKCKLIECHNFRLCGKKYPQYILYCYNGMCPDCAIRLGKIKFPDIKGICPICMENKDMIQITCGKHNLCLECWTNISETTFKTTNTILSCPLCRENIWKWKGR
jgi:hypothetical protein